MALTNLVLTVAAIGAVILVARTDVKQSAAIFRRNARHLRNWLEKYSSKAAEKVKPKEINPQGNHKDSLKGEKE